ncbi:MAG: hypothetical protein HC929_24475 [Leptolyngbyaceae cyanobacterium SM2_5_2]|nr:hypothetical protein [Leptolyngbyaceae cyanobacterium SM2_5_2]
MWTRCLGAIALTGLIQGLPLPPVAADARCLNERCLAQTPLDKPVPPQDNRPPGGSSYRAG